MVVAAEHGGRLGGDRHSVTKKDCKWSGRHAAGVFMDWGAASNVATAMGFSPHLTCHTDSAHGYTQGSLASVEQALLPDGSTVERLSTYVRT
jgi:hypothetical protein